jgi:hypothetical protein
MRPKARFPPFRLHVLTVIVPVDLVGFAAFLYLVASLVLIDMLNHQDMRLSSETIMIASWLW